MPAKSPPAVIESLTMVVARVLGNDQVAGFAQTGSILELNVMMPVVIAASLESVELLSAVTENFAERCVEGIVVTEQGPRNVERAVMLTTALSPEIGYDAAADISREALATGETVREVALRRGLSAERLDALLDPEAMTEPSCAPKWPADETL
jgi:fumarate hydratase class II